MQFNIESRCVPIYKSLFYWEKQIQNRYCNDPFEKKNMNGCDGGLVLRRGEGSGVGTTFIDLVAIVAYLV